MPHRKRLHRHEDPGQVRYLTFSCYRRLALFANNAIKQAFIDKLDAVRREFHFELYAWVVMPEHIHLLIMPALPEHPVSEILHAIKRPIAERVLARWRELDASILPRLRDSGGHLHFWLPGGGYDRNTYSDTELFEKIEYIHNNPVRRGLANRAVDYGWSSAPWYDGQAGAFPAMDPLP